MRNSLKRIRDFLERKRRKPGRNLLIILAGSMIPSGFIADWNKTHLFNPQWTPHSKFHDAMTILQAFFLGTAGLYFLNNKDGDPNQNLALGTMLPALFWLSMLIAFTFPKTKGLEAEFPQKVPKLGPLWLNEAPASLLLLSLLAVGYFVEKKRLDLGKNKKP